MTSAWIIGAYSTTFGHKPDQSHKDLTREAYEGVLADAARETGAEIEAVWFGNCGLAALGQSSIRGQVCFIPLVRENRFPERVPMFNVENACATGSTALYGARSHILSGGRLALAIGVEKLFTPGATAPPKMNGGGDALNPEEMIAYYRNMGERAGKPFETRPDRSIFMDTYAMQAAYHMKRYGTTQRQIAIAAAKTHAFGVDNEKAQYRFALTVEQVLDDREISFPLTRAMCAPIGDGASALLVCSGDYLAGLDATTRARAVRLRGIGVSGGKYRQPEEVSLTRLAADRAYAEAHVEPEDIDVAEVHDATSFSEIYQSEMMRFCPEGRGGPFIEEGGGRLDHGRLSLNTSGGLVSKGHPIAATGCSMVYELVRQLRGEAGARQRRGARLALAENGGGAIGFDEAVCFVTILERT